MLFSWRSVFQSKKSTNSKEEVGSSKTESPHASTPNAGSTYTGVSTETTQAKQEPGFDGSKEEIPDANVTMAAYWVASVLSVLKVEYAVVGGFALRMRGSARKINHVEFGVNLTRVKLRDFLKKLPDRFMIPEGIGFDQMVHMEVKTGPACGDALESNYNVRVDLILPGSLGVPHSRRLTDERELINANLRGITIGIWALNLRYTMRAKLAVFEARKEDADFEDILFLIRTYPSDIAQFGSDLSEEQRGLFFKDDRWENFRDEFMQAVRVLDFVHYK